MTRFVNIGLQLLGLLAQYGNYALDIVPPKYKGLAAAIIGLLQAIVAITAHGVNPDGTSATTAYVAK
jgi:hypothetical protein